MSKLKFNKGDQVSVKGFYAKDFPNGGSIGRWTPICNKVYYFVYKLRSKYNPLRIFSCRTDTNDLLPEKELTKMIGRYE